MDIKKIKMKNLNIYNSIEFYGSKCIELNSVLISKFSLNTNSDLQDINYLLLPFRASRLKIINYKGSFISENQSVEYHIHGTGITFYLNEIKYSFNFEPINGNIQPIFSISSLYDYITLIYKKMDHNDFTEIIAQLIDKKLLINIHEKAMSYYIPKLELPKDIPLK